MADKLKKIFISKKVSDLFQTFSYNELNAMEVLSIYISDEEDLATIINDKELFKTESIESLDEYCSFNGEETKTVVEEKKRIQEIFISQRSLIDEFDYVEVDTEELDIMSVLASVPKLREKKILLDENFDITDKNSLEVFAEKYSEIKDNLYVSLSGNTNPTKIVDALTTINAIEEFVNYVKKFNFSPMEAICFSFDVIRNRIYNEETKEEDETISRDLTSVLLGNKIVCLGYAVLFNSILKSLNIPGCILKMTQKHNPNSGHARNIVYLKDDKYGINGIYSIDATWSSRKKGHDEIFPYRYQFFLRTFSEMISDDKEKYDYIKLSPDCQDYLMQVLNSNSQKSLFELGKSKQIRQHINYISELVYGKNILLKYYYDKSSLRIMNKKIDKEQIEEQIKNCLALMNKSINAEAYIGCLFNVRKVQYYIDETMYPFDLQSFYTTEKLADWKFADDSKNEDELINAIFGSINPEYRKFLKYTRLTNMRTNIAGIRLSKCLRNYLEGKK